MHVPVDTFAPWRCPNENGDRHHVLLIEEVDNLLIDDDPNPFIAFRQNMMWWQFATANAMSDEKIVQLVRELDLAIADVDGTGFHFTPITRQEKLSDELGFIASGGVWVKDETHNVGGSQKARHLMSILLHLLIAEELKMTPWASRATRPPLAISSCGNAAIAAATLAAAVNWPIDVFIPEWADGIVVDTLTKFGARIHRCPRRDNDLPGDPTVLRFREAVTAGAIPFSVQGPENALCLDGGRTIGWEMAKQLRAENLHQLTAVYVQVGGGAFAASLSRGLSESGFDVPLVAVQTAGCAPLERAWKSARDVADCASEWATHMWPWEEPPASLADGILDDETYDWVADTQQLRRTNGRVVVACEEDVVRAASIGPNLTAIQSSATGTAGLAGLLSERSVIGDSDRVVLVLSGISRH